MTLVLIVLVVVVGLTVLGVYWGWCAVEAHRNHLEFRAYIHDPDRYSHAIETTSTRRHP